MNGIARRLVFALTSSLFGLILGTAAVVTWYTLLLQHEHRIPSEWEFVLEEDEEDEDDYTD